MSDPKDVIDSLSRAEESFDSKSVLARHEVGIESGGGWETQLTKGCRLLAAVEALQTQDGYHTAVTELCFGAIERSVEAYAVAMAGDGSADFHDHETCYERAAEVGLFERETADRLRDLYGDNRTESYYGESRPTAEQASAMADLSRSVHDYSSSQILVGHVCIC